jgi:hypothetical protein
VENHGTDLLPFFGHNVVTRAGSFEFVLFSAKASKHINEALVIAYGLFLKILISWVTLFFEHQLILVIEQKDIGAINQEYRVV